MTVAIRWFRNAFAQVLPEMEFEIRTNDIKSILMHVMRLIMTCVHKIYRHKGKTILLTKLLWPSNHVGGGVGLP